MIRIRVSSLPFYLDCPRRAAAGVFNYQIKGAGFSVNKYPPGVAAAIGQGAHAGAQHIVDRMCHLGRPAELGQAQEAGIVQYKKAVTEGAMYDDITPNNNAAEKQIQTITRSYYYEIAPGLNVEGLATEKALKAKLGEATITGHLDFNTPAMIRDLKTGRVASFIAQLGGYSLLKRSNGGQAGGLAIDFCPRVRIDKPYPGASTVNYNLQLAESTAFQIIKKMIRDIKEFEETGDPWAFAANPKSMLCNPKYCSCYKTDFCPLGGI
ncbi:MAG: hypothetical protein GTN53_22910 [Candidatus Aminicenantes bacterium]|nr:hypothetical protein [Candidatus Aminicenantes bacterium]NIQ69355.1 hypothetical protein [Candidatus Aminicenantes bacterium]NIT25356.1 hypothetical protein [Candidatus Aminicenantes bacterium]